MKSLSFYRFAIANAILTLICIQVFSIAIFFEFRTFFEYAGYSFPVLLASGLIDGIILLSIFRSKNYTWSFWFGLINILYWLVVQIYFLLSIYGVFSYDPELHQQMHTVRLGIRFLSNLTLIFSIAGTDQTLRITGAAVTVMILCRVIDAYANLGFNGYLNLVDAFPHVLIPYYYYQQLKKQFPSNNLVIDQ